MAARAMSTHKTIVHKFKAYEPKDVPENLQQKLIDKNEIDPFQVNDSLVDYLKEEILEGTGVVLVTDGGRRGPYWSLYEQGEGVSLNLLVNDLEKFCETNDLDPEIPIDIQERTSFSLHTEQKILYASHSTISVVDVGLTPEDLEGDSQAEAYEHWRESNESEFEDFLNDPEAPKYIEASAYRRTIENVDDAWRHFVSSVEVSALKFLYAEYDYLNSWGYTQEVLECNDLLVDEKGNTWHRNDPSIEVIG